MKMILKDIKDAEQSLSSILTTKIDFKLAYRLDKITKKIVGEIKTIEEFRLKLVDKFGVKEKDKDGKETGRLSVPPEKYDEFNKEFMEFLGKESTTEFEPIPYELLENSGIRLSAADLVNLEKFISEPIAK
jgi:hypothetical protein